MENSPVKKREIFGWAMFDFANSSYTTVVITAIYNGFFVKYIVPENSALKDSYWSIAIIAGTLLTLFLSPVVGAICDYSGKKKRFLAFTVSLCVICTFGLYFVGPGDIYLGIGLVALSFTGFILSENFCAAFLPEIATKENMGKISGIGWGIGYFGGLASLILVLAVVTAKPEENLSQFISQNQLAMFLTGVFFLIAALPTFILVKERAKVKPGFENASIGKFVGVGLGSLKNGFQTAKENQTLFSFFKSFLFFMAGLNAAISFAGIYARVELNFNTGDLTIMFLIIQITSAAGAFGFGFLEKKLGPRITLLISLSVWVLGCIILLFLPNIAELLTMDPKKVFFAVALFIGIGVGSTQTTSRAIVGRLCPAEKTGEIFGFWGFFNRLATIMGMVYGFLADGLDSRRLSILLVLVFFMVGMAILYKMDLKGSEAHSSS